MDNDVGVSLAVPDNYDDFTTQLDALKRANVSVLELYLSHISTLRSFVNIFISKGISSYLDSFSYTALYFGMSDMNNKIYTYDATKSKYLISNNFHELISRLANNFNVLNLSTLAFPSYIVESKHLFVSNMPIAVENSYNDGSKISQLLDMSNLDERIKFVVDIASALSNGTRHLSSLINVFKTRVSYITLDYNKGGLNSSTASSTTIKTLSYCRRFNDVPQIKELDCPIICRSRLDRVEDIKQFSYELSSIRNYFSSK